MEAQRPSVDHREPLPGRMEADRAEMIARQARMSLEQRLDLFERLSRDAAWIRSSAKRIR